VVWKPPFNAACPCAMQADGSDAEGSDDDAMGAAEPDPVAAAAAANAAEQDEQQAAAADKAGSPGEPAGGLPWPAPGAYDMHKRCGYWSRQHAAGAALQAWVTPTLHSGPFPSRPCAQVPAPVEMRPRLMAPIETLPRRFRV